MYILCSGCSCYVIGKWNRKRGFDKLIGDCFAMHRVAQPKHEWCVPSCPDGNPLGYDCPTCKGFKLYGICSHVVAVNHLMKKLDVYAMLDVLTEVPKKNRGGYTKGVRPALSREDAITARERAMQRALDETHAEEEEEDDEAELVQLVRPRHTSVRPLSSPLFCEEVCLVCDVQAASALARNERVAAKKAKFVWDDDVSSDNFPPPKTIKYHGDHKRQL